MQPLMTKSDVFITGLGESIGGTMPFAADHTNSYFIYQNSKKAY
jgi:hypothetical protein